MTCGTIADPSVSYLPLSNYGWNLKDSLNFATDEYSGYKAVVIGGGTGAPVSIKTLLAMGVQTSAVVAMADDGGSTGLIRESTSTVPPGDIRKCLTAMAPDRTDPFVNAFKYRFDYAYNHTLGNLMLTALADVADFPTAIEICERMLNCLGHVYPSTLDQIELEGVTRDDRMLKGQSSIVHSDTALERVWLNPAQPVAYKPALQAIKEADLIVLGPGSLFTSIIPNLLVPGVVEAISQSDAKTVFLCSVADMQGETWGLNCAEHVQALLDHGMHDLLHVACINTPPKVQDANSTGAIPIIGNINSPREQTHEFEALTINHDGSVDATYNASASRRVIRRVSTSPEYIAQIQRQVPVVMQRQIVDPVFPTWHSPRALGEIFKGVFELCHSLQK